MSAVVVSARERRGMLLRGNPGHPGHGTRAGYVDGCRCHACGWAKAVAEAELRERRAAELAGDPDHRLHGSTTGYTYGCRCESCRAAHSVQNAAYRKAVAR